MRPTVLIAEDEASQRLSLREFVMGTVAGDVLEAENGYDAVELIESRMPPRPDMLLLDYHMPEMNGLEVIQRIRPNHPHLPIIVLTMEDKIDLAVEAMRAGADDYMVKPFDQQRLLVSMQQALKLRQLQDEVDRLKRHDGGMVSFDDVIGESPSFQETIRLARRAAASYIPVFITGRSGCGKEMFARAIHGASARAGKPFVAVNCGAIPPNLVESTLFGHEKGAFTGATDKALGHFRAANGGTIMLDEVGELPLSVQVALLRVLQEGEVQPVGAANAEPVDVRVISATNQTLETMVENGAFREDLYYRLNVYPLSIPTLRERPEDIMLLARYFLMRIAMAEHRSIDGFAPPLERMLCAYHWPGNVREMENMIYRAVVMCDEAVLQPSHFPQLSGENIVRPANVTTSDVMSLSLLDDAGALKHFGRLEHDIILLACDFYDGNMSKVAAALGMGRSTLYRKLAAHQEKRRA